jgi:hypothetical protein
MAEKLTLLAPSPRLGRALLFRSGGAEFIVDDAVAFAAFRGELDAAIAECRALIAAEERAADEDLVIEDEAAQALSDAFRYKHELISAAETEAWLEARAMTADDFSRWIYQSLCHERSGTVGEGKIDADFPDLLRVHLWFSESMTTLENHLRCCVAAGREVTATNSRAVLEQFLERQQFDEDATAEWLCALGRDREWLEWAAGLQAAYETLARKAVHAEARARKLRSNQMTLARLEVETLALESGNAAREAILCVQQDRVTLAEVAREAGYRADRHQLWAGEFDSALAQRLLGASQGAVVGPVERDGRFDVYQVIRKISPSLDDPAVANRVDAMLIDETFDELCSRYIE